MSSHPSNRTALLDSADTLPLPRTGQLFRRALRLRCPACGGRPILLSWFTVAPSCPACGLHTDRDEPGYWIGSYTVNLFVTEGVFAVVFAAGLLLTWPAVPWTALTVLCAALAILTPVMIFPHTKLLYLAIDLAFRPLEPPDLEAPRERSFAIRSPQR
jgi:uncharacterized protein (DUF983 family)